MTNADLITIRDLKKSFGNRPVLNGITTAIHPAELVVLIGPSGCGKSTLLRCLNGLETFDSGEIGMAGVTLKRTHPIPVKDKAFHAQAELIRQHAGMVFQSFNLFPHKTLIENVMMAPIVVNGLARDEAQNLAEKLLAKVGLSEHADKRPLTLSGGQQQRGAIARALAMSPKVMLYDEPTSALDPGLTDEVWQVMRGLDQEGLSQIVVTHEYRFAKDLADRILFLDEGQIVEDAPPQQMFTNPQDERTRQFLRHYL